MQKRPTETSMVYTNHPSLAYPKYASIAAAKIIISYPRYIKMYPATPIIKSQTGPEKPTNTSTKNRITLTILFFIYLL
ncbi:MAG: hypothetical protein ACI92I_000994 [Acidimicrobiales bacterium]|jgi:hypothetical protein